MSVSFPQAYDLVIIGHSKQLTPGGVQNVTVNVPGGPSGALFRIETEPYNVNFPCGSTPPSSFVPLPAGVVDSGFITDVTLPAGVNAFTTAELALLEPGAFGFFNPTTFEIVTTPPGTCCDLIIAASSPYKNDSINQFIRGYRTTIKSKPINPKNIRQFIVQQPFPAQQGVYVLGNTPYNPANCCFNFQCGLSYTLRVKVWGSSVYSTYFRDEERLVTAHGGCCPQPNCSGGPCITPTYIDPAIIYLQWANLIAEDPELRRFIFPILYINGTYYYPPKSLYPDLTYPAGAVTWDTASITFQPNQNTPFCSNTNPPQVGIIFQTAYVETRFGNCTFDVRDGYNFEPVMLNVSIWDTFRMERDPNNVLDPKCSTGLCFTTICPGMFAETTGEAALRQLALSEGIRGFNDLYTDSYCVEHLRAREITQANQLFDLVDRNALYTKYTIIYDYTETGNPNTLTRVTDTYKLEIYALGRIPAFETFMINWAGVCGCDKFRIVCGNQCDIPPTLAPYLLPNTFYQYSPAPQRTNLRPGQEVR